MNHFEGNSEQISDSVRPSMRAYLFSTHATFIVFAGQSMEVRKKQIIHSLACSEILLSTHEYCTLLTRPRPDSEYGPLRQASCRLLSLCQFRVTNMQLVRHIQHSLKSQPSINRLQTSHSSPHSVSQTDSSLAYFFRTERKQTA